MEFQPKAYTILDEDRFPDAMPKIEKELSLYAHSGTFPSFDGTKIAYEYFLCRNARANVVVVHGFTEFYRKYHELAWYLLHEGYNVFLYDHRGHGLSQRDVNNMEMVHVEYFDDYAKDLACMIDSIITPAAPGLALNIYAHSMGGAATLLYLADHSDQVNKVFLSAPMITPYAGGVPRFMIAIGAKRFLKKNGPLAHFPYSGRFNPNANFQNSPDASFSRFTYYLNMRIDNRCYQTSGATNRWMSEVAQLQSRLLKRDFAKKLTAEICLVSCDNDRVVRTKQQYRLAARLPHCTLVTVPQASHSLYTATGEQLQAFYDYLFGFFR